MTDDEPDNFQPCCPAWAKAHEWGTDNEGYSPLIGTAYPGKHLSGLPEKVSRTGYSSELPDIKFCPWCGSSKTARQ